MTDHTKALLLMAATALIWSSGGLAIKLIDWNPMAITGFRSGLAALTLTVLFRGRLRFRFSAVQWAAAGGYAGLLITNVVATKWTTSANAILLAYTAIVYVALLAPWLLGEKTRRSDWVFITVTVGGMILFFLDKLTPTGLLGNVVAVGTGLSYALFTLCMRAQKDASPVESVILGHGITALCGLPFMFAALPGAEGWAGLLYLGVFQQGRVPGALRLGHQAAGRAGGDPDHDARTDLQPGLGGPGLRRAAGRVGHCRGPAGHRRGHPPGRVRRAAQPSYSLTPARDFPFFSPAPSLSSQTPLPLRMSDFTSRVGSMTTSSSLISLCWSGLMIQST